MPNLRDIGGYAVAGGGRVRMGQLYRSVELNHLHGDDLTAMEALGIRTVFDLRTEDERKAQPDVVPAGAEEVVCDVLAGDKQTAPAQLYQVLGDPVAAGKMLGGGKAVALFEHGYRQTVGLPSALTAYRTFFETIARDARRPALFHCTTGKDRTGWAAASTLLFLGVAEDDVFHDYLLTNRDLLAGAQAAVRQVRGRRRRPAPARAGAGRGAGLPAHGDRRDEDEVRLRRGLLHRRAGPRRGDAARRSGGRSWSRPRSAALWGAARAPAWRLAGACYQMSARASLPRTIGDVSGSANAAANAGRFESGPFTRARAGECGSTLVMSRRYSSV